MNKNLSELQEDFQEECSSENEADANLSSDGNGLFNPEPNLQIGLAEVDSFCEK